MAVGVDPGVPLDAGHQLRDRRDGRVRRPRCSYRLVIDWDVPFWVAFACVRRRRRGSSAPRVELVIVRRLFRRRASILLVALIGARAGAALLPVDPPRRSTRVRPYPTAFSGRVGDRRRARPGRAAVLVVMPLLVDRADLFLNRTKYGMAIRASAANADAARLSASDIKKMSTLVWVIAGVLAATGHDALRPAQPARPRPRRSASGPACCCVRSPPRSSAAWSRCRCAVAGGVAIGIAEACSSTTTRARSACSTSCCSSSVLVILLVMGTSRIATPITSTPGRSRRASAPYPRTSRGSGSCGTFPRSPPRSRSWRRWSSRSS